MVSAVLRQRAGGGFSSSLEAVDTASTMLPTAAWKSSASRCISALRSVALRVSGLVLLGAQPLGLHHAVLERLHRAGERADLVLAARRHDTSTVMSPPASRCIACLDRAAAARSRGARSSASCRRRAPPPARAAPSCTESVPHRARALLRGVIVRDVQRDVGDAEHRAELRHVLCRPTASTVISSFSPAITLLEQAGAQLRHEVAPRRTRASPCRTAAVKPGGSRHAGRRILEAPSSRYRACCTFAVYLTIGSAGSAWPPSVFEIISGGVAAGVARHPGELLERHQLIDLARPRASRGASGGSESLSRVSEQSARLIEEVLAASAARLVRLQECRARIS